MSVMELYDPAFPCDPDLPDGSETAVNEDTDINIANTTHDECSQLQLSSIELPPEPYKPELFQNAETSSSSNKEHDSKDCAKAADIQDYPKKSNSSTVTEDSVNKVEDADGDDAIEDDARYRDELKKLAAVRQTKDFESKSAKDVPLEIYLGPSVGFRVDLTMNKNRKLSVESIAKKCHDDVFERLSPERRGKAKSAAKSGETQSGSRIDFKSPSKTPVKSDVLEESSGEVFRQKKSESSGEVFRQKKSESSGEVFRQKKSESSGEVFRQKKSESSGEVFRQKKSESSGEVFRQKSRHNERSTFVESGEDSDKDLRSLLRKREAENQALLAVPRVVKMKHLEGKTEDNLTGRSDETPPSRKSRPHENDRDRFELSSQKRTDYSDPKRSKHRRYEAEMESDHPEYRDGSTSRKSNAREKEREVREREEPKRSKPSKHVREEEYESRHRSEERPRAGRSENKELSSSTNKSRDRERLPEIVTDPDHRSRRKRRNSRSVSNEHKKKLCKSKSRSPKRKRDRSKSGDRRRTKDGRSKSREQERRHEKKSEAKLKNDDRYVSPPRHKKDHRHHRSRSKTPVREPESKKATRSRHSDIKETSYYEDLWPSFDDGAPRSDRNKSKQPSLRELQERSTSLLEACMKTRYENQGSGDDRHRSRRHRHKDKRDFVQSLNFGRTSGKPGSVDYITLSDSDEGIVWSDNEEEEEYGNYNCLPAVRSESSKKQKYEDIYSSRSLQCTENRLPSRSPPKPPKSRSHRESSLSPSAIIAINLKRKENSKRLEKLKITKRVSRSSLEPGEIDDGSSLDLSDNGLIEEEPTRRMVSLINEDEGANRWPGDKVPIQIHVITSHGDGRSGKADEIMSMTDCDDNIAGFVTTTDDAVGVADFPLRCDQKADAQLGPEEDMMCVDEHDSDDKELPGDLVICTGNSPLDVEKPELHLTSDRDGLDLVYASQKTPPIEEHPVAEDFKKSADVTNNGERQVMSADPLLSTDAKSKDVFDFVARKDDSFFNSPKKTETIPGLGDVFPSPVKEQDIEPSPVGTRNLSSFYHIKKKTNFEQASLRLDLNSEPPTPKAHGTHLASPRKALSQKEDPAKTTQNSSPQKSPNVESAGPASHQISSTFPQNVPGMPRTSASSVRVSEGLLTVDTEPLPPSDRQSSKLGFPKLAPSTNAYILNQNAIVDLLASFPSSSSALIQQPVSAAASHDDNPISKLLAAFNPMLGTLGAASSANLQSQKLIDDIVKSTAVAVPVGSPQMSSIDSKTGSVTDDRLTNIFNMQKKLLELTRISAGAPQPAAPFSQKLVQDIFKAVLVPTSSAMKSSSDLSSLCPRTSEIPISLSQDNSLSPTSPFNVDAASPLSGEIMSFSPPSIPDTNSPVVMKVEKTPKQMKPESKNSTHKTKSKDGKSAKAKPEDDVKDKKSKSDIQKLVVEEVKTIIRPFYSKGRINKDEYKEIMRKTVPSICNSKTQDFSKTRITIYVEAYIRKVQAARKYHAKKKDK